MTRIEEVEAERVVLQTQFNRCAVRIKILEQIESMSKMGITGLNILFKDKTTETLYLEKEEEQDELKTTILKILEERIKDE